MTAEASVPIEPTPVPEVVEEPVVVPLQVAQEPAPESTPEVNDEFPKPVMEPLATDVGLRKSHIESATESEVPVLHAEPATLPSASSISVPLTPPPAPLPPSIATWRAYAAEKRAGKKRARLEKSSPSHASAGKLPTTMCRFFSEFPMQQPAAMCASLPQLVASPGWGSRKDHFTR